MKKLLPVLFLILGLALGVGAGLFLKPPPVEAEATPAAPPVHGGAAFVRPAASNTETLRMPNQFIVPLLSDGRVRAMVVIGLALELTQGHTISLAADEARLRAMFLQRLFDHANMGGFDGAFTGADSMAVLQRVLRESAQALMGPSVVNVLITELVRQDN